MTLASLPGAVGLRTIRLFAGSELTIVWVKMLMILLGGAAGAGLRYGVSGLAYRIGDGAFPWGTVAVNLIGSFVIGLLYEPFQRSMVPEEFRAFVFIGLLGAFTTFSTYSLETLNLLREGETKLAVAYIGVNNLAGLALVFLGFAASKFFMDLAK